MASLTWLGHASFRLDTSGGARVYIDPWLEGNPRCPSTELEPERCDAVAVTHGHGDHVSAAPELCRRFSAPVVAMVELAKWLSEQGVENAIGMNKGGTVELAGVRFTMTNAFHSSSVEDADGATVYTGEAAGYVVEPEDGTSVYFAGDTCVFSDMALIGRLYAPDVAVLPIGGHYTMDTRQAALALELLGSKRCVPCHWGTFPLLPGTPDELRRLVGAGVEVVSIEPGETVEL